MFYLLQFLTFNLYRLRISAYTQIMYGMYILDKITFAQQLHDKEFDARLNQLQ